MGAYVFDNSWEKERVRLAGLESMLDPGTRRHLPGAFFGEVALLTHGPRTATVTADTGMKLLRLDERRFTALLEEAPTVGRKILDGVAKRLGDQS